VTAPRTFGLIPAAGKSRRMGRPKLALPLGGRTVLEHVVAAVRGGGIAEVLVVLAPHVAELAAPARAAGAHVVLLEEETPEMRVTVERGLAWLEERFAPRDDDRWLLLPADHPTLDAAAVARLLEARAGTACSVVVPEFAGRRGHPTLIDWRHAAGVRAVPAGQGLNVYLRQLGAEVLAVPFDSGAVLCDLDTPEDYERLRRRWEG
jgi:molybdenum cofactor cytidylyltransferase